MGAGEGLVSLSKTLWQTRQGCWQTYYISWGNKMVISLLQDYLLSLIWFHSRVFFLKKLRSRTSLKDPLCHSPLCNLAITPRPPAFSVCAHEEKAFAGIPKKKRKRRASPSCSSPGWERENSTLLPCLSQSHIRSDHWWIKALPDTSLPLSGGSRHALGTQNDRMVAERMKKWNFFSTRAKEKKRGRWERERKDVKGELRWGQMEWKCKGR